MDERLQKAIAAITIFVLVAVVAYPMIQQNASSDLEGSNEDPLYSMVAKSPTDTVTLAMADGSLAIDGVSVTSMDLPDSVLLMSDVLIMDIDTTTGAFTAWSILLEEQSCTATSADDPTLVFTFDEAHLTITDTADPTVSLSSWYRYLLVPDVEGDLGAWSVSDMPGLVVGKTSIFYVAEASGAHAGTVYGMIGNVAAGQNVSDGSRVYGSASAVYETVLNNTAASVTSFDTEGGIVGDDALFVCEKTYTYNTQTGFTVDLLMSVAAILILLLALVAALKVIM